MLDQPQVLLNAGEVHNLCHEANTGCKPPAVTFRTLKPSTATASRCSSQSHLLRRRAQRRSADWTGRFAAASFTHFLLFDEQRILAIRKCCPSHANVPSNPNLCGSWWPFIHHWTKTCRNCCRPTWKITKGESNCSWQSYAENGPNRLGNHRRSDKNSSTHQIQSESSTVSFSSSSVGFSSTANHEKS